MSSKHKLSFIDKDLEERKKNNQLRSLHSLLPESDSVSIIKNGRKLLNFCSNDYLGLSKNSNVIKKASEYAERYGAGSTASRLITGTFDIHEKLESKIANTFNREAALLFNSGFQANSTIIQTLTTRHSLVLADKLSHNSLLQGSILSRARLQRFEHNNLNHLEQLLKEAETNGYDHVLVVTETVFSMDGDRCDVSAVAELAEKYNALLFVDDAHAVGVWGDKGLGLGFDISGIDILLGTCGKAFGSFGAYVACSQKMKDYLVNYCPGFIYTTALPPAVVGAVESSLKLIPDLDKERQEHHGKIFKVIEQLQELGFDTGPTSTQIIPVILGDESKTIELAKWLETQGILATAIRPPTVPENSSRIRMTITGQHTDAQIDYFLAKMKEWKNA